MKLHGTSRINEQGYLEIGGVHSLDLAEQFQTPLIVYDVSLMRQRMRSFKETFEKHGITAQVAYASKAFSCKAMIQLVEQEGLSLDVVSAGELYTAIQAGFPPEKIHFHGNNKSTDEIRMGVEAGIGCFVTDNFYEIALLEEVSKEAGKPISVLLRITPGIEAHTHDYILTGHEDSKFGFDLGSGQVEQAIMQAENSEFINLLGVHCHIGSQIFESTGFVMAAEKIFEAMSGWRTTLNYIPKVMNLGGGFGIRYTDEDDPLEPNQYIEEIIHAVKGKADQYSMAVPEIWIEPGRSIVGDAGTTLYHVGSTKEIPNVRKYVAVNGGMSDNLRPALYQAKYEALLANRANEKADELVSIAGKCCESGDMLIWDVNLPEVRSNDILAVFCTGAYGYSMSNNYNRIPRPAVVFVENGEAKLVIRRENYEDLVKYDFSL